MHSVQSLSVTYRSAVWGPKQHCVRRLDIVVAGKTMGLGLDPLARKPRLTADVLHIMGSEVRGSASGWSEHAD